MPSKLPECDYKCFECVFPDCINNKPPTKEEAYFLAAIDLFGVKGRRKKVEDNGGRWSD